MPINIMQLNNGIQLNVIAKANNTVVFEMQKSCRVWQITRSEAVKLLSQSIA